MKKAATLFLAVALMLCIMLPVFSASVNTVSAETVSAKAGETVSIPVKIEGNNGFMGFGIIVNYDPSILTPESVSKGSILSGMFEDSITTSEPGSFKVIHAGTTLNEENGDLFTLVFRVAENAKSTQITLEAVKEDTFDENYQDIVLKCEPIPVTIEGGTSDPTDPTNPDNPTNPSEPEEEKLSDRIQNWASNLSTPLNSIMGVVVAPIVFVLRLFGK